MTPAVIAALSTAIVAVLGAIPAVLFAFQGKKTANTAVTKANVANATAQLAHAIATGTAENLTESNTMSETPEVTAQVNPPTEIDGATLMGVRAPVTDPPSVEGPSPVDAPETATDPIVTPVVPPVASAPVSPSQLRSLADFLENL